MSGSGDRKIPTTRKQKRWTSILRESRSRKSTIGLTRIPPDVDWASTTLTSILTHEIDQPGGITVPMLNWEQTFTVLREKSTLAGLVGLAVAVAAAFGVHVAPGQEALITEIVLAIISMVAIFTRPRPPSRYNHPETWHDRSSDDRDVYSDSNPDRRIIGDGRAGEASRNQDKAAGEGN